MREGTLHFVSLQPSIKSIEFCNLGSRVAIPRDLEMSSALIVCKNRSRPRRAILIVVTPLENFLWKCSMGYTLYPWISLLESTLETSYKPQT